MDNTNTFSNVSSSPSSSSPSSYQDIIATVQSVSTRNAIIGAATVMITSFVIILIATATKLKHTIKVTLLNLLLSDIAVMLPAFFSGFLGQMDSSNGYCIAIIFFFIYGFLLNHAAVTWLSFINFLAVFFPFKHNVWLTRRFVTGAVVLIWLVVFLISGSCMMVDFQLGLPCAVLGTVSRYGSVIIFCMFLLCDFSVVVMNISLCVALRTRRRVHVISVGKDHPNRGGAGPSREVPGGPKAVQPVDQEGDQGSSVTQSSKCGEGSSITVSTLPPVHISNILAVPKPDFPVQYSLGERAPSTIAVLPSLIPGPSSSEQGVVAVRETGRGIEQGGDNQPENFNKDVNVLSANKLSRLFKAAEREIPKTVRFQSTLMRRTQSRLSISLVIICLWCCMFNLPFLMYLFLITFMVEDRIHFHYSQWGVMATTILAVNVMGDPFIYVWRFVPWSNLMLRLRTFCRRHWGNR